MKRNVPQAIIDYRIAQSENVTPVPGRSTPYITSALKQAARSRWPKLPAPTTVSYREAAELARIQAEIEQPQVVIEHDPSGLNARAG